MAVVPNEQWTDLFVATAGASAALAGLVIVAVSVNVQEILKYSNLPARAMATIGTLVLILVVSIAALIPEQDAMWLGLEVIAFALLAWVFVLRASYQSLRLQSAARRAGSLPEVLLGQAQIALFLIAGVLFLADNADGLYWVTAGIILVFIAAIINTWVLLIEILR